MSPRNQYRRGLYSYIDGYEDLSVILINCSAMIGPALMAHIQKQRDKDQDFLKRSRDFAKEMRPKKKPCEKEKWRGTYWGSLSKDVWPDNLHADIRELIKYVDVEGGVPGLTEFARDQTEDIGDLRDLLNGAYHGKVFKGQEQDVLNAVQKLLQLANKLSNAKVEQQDLERVVEALKLRAQHKSRHRGSKPAELKRETSIGVHWVEPTDTIPGSWSVVSIPPNGKTATVEHELTTPQVYDLLTEPQQSPLRVGLAFCFSCPEGELMKSWKGDPRELWAWCENFRGDKAPITADGLKQGNDKFRELAYKDKGKMYKPDHDPSVFRKTELQMHAVLGPEPASFFDVGGEGSVGALAIKGLPLLKDLYDAGATVWPLLAKPREGKASGMTCVEIYPGGLWTSLFPDEPHQSKKSRMRRREFLLDVQNDKALRGLTRRNRDLFIERERTFDALLTAWALHHHGNNLEELNKDVGGSERLEGKFWLPTTLK